MDRLEHDVNLWISFISEYLDKLIETLESISEFLEKLQNNIEQFAILVVTSPGWIGFAIGLAITLCVAHTCYYKRPNYLTISSFIVLYAVFIYLALHDNPIYKALDLTINRSSKYLLLMAAGSCASVVSYLSLKFLAFRIYGLISEIIKKIISIRFSARKSEINISKSIKNYDPSKYFNRKKGILIGLDNGKPIYTSNNDLHEAHFFISGMTAYGKSMLSTNILVQKMMFGGSIVVFDPKGDTHLPYVLNHYAKKYGYTYSYIDLNGENSQLNPIYNKKASEIEDLICTVFGLMDTKTGVDYYSSFERRIARRFSEYAVDKIGSVFEIFNQFIIDIKPNKDEYEKISNYFDEIKSVKACSAKKGFNFEGAFKGKNVIVIRGSILSSKVKAVQAMLFISVCQFIVRGVKNNNTVTIFADEVYSMVSASFVGYVGTLRSAGASIIAAAQGIVDLKNTDGSVDGEISQSCILQNTAIKISFRCGDVETSEYYSNYSGQYEKTYENVHVENNFGLKEVERGRSVSVKAENKISLSDLRSLPKRQAYYFGIDCVNKIDVSFLKYAPDSAALESVNFIDCDNEILSVGDLFNVD